MKEYDLKLLIENTSLQEQKIQEYLSTKTITQQKCDPHEIEGHLLKAEHNLRFVQENIKIGFLDWAITGCYYACYHAALSLILTRGYSSKNHLATLCILIREFYQKELNKEDIETLSILLDYQDVLFYVEAKNKREEASYSTKLKFTKPEVEALKLKASLFITKIKTIVKN